MVHLKNVRPIKKNGFDKSEKKQPSKWTQINALSFYCHNKHLLIFISYNTHFNHCKHMIFLRFVKNHINSVIYLRMLSFYCLYAIKYKNAIIKIYVSNWRTKNSRKFKLFRVRRASAVGNALLVLLTNN